MMRTMMKAGLLAMAVAGGALAPAWAQTLLYLDELSDGDSHTVPVKAEIRARFTQQAGTPYQWEMRNDPHVALIAQPTIEDKSNGRIGGRQLKTFRIRVTQPGRFPLIFGLRSSTAGANQVPARRILVTIDAQAERRYEPAPIDGPDTVEPLTRGDAGRSIDIPVGQEQTIALDSNPSTGYSWRVVRADNVSMAGPIQYQGAAAPRGMVGRGGTALISFRVSRRGLARLTLEYSGGPGRPGQQLTYFFDGI